ncbi:hypothetical protein [Diatraea saccharalis granulovirus]|uniref:Uncharacterized protein n=1 Tax=Diatraea saccharalis granulovirus TaxID=1675862 RepID=A0A0R7EYQ5_9BBAC|nr:hypothetical protein [Diatraea saccharalis granulovirus]AKN80725.1 hypothetical protein [Diatraea saccharalis granulovirus]
MDNFDLLDELLYENRVFLKQIVVFVISATLIFLITSLLFAVFNYRNSLNEQREVVTLKNLYLNK